MSSIASLVSLDHILTVKDLDLSTKFYRDFLGMIHTVFAARSVERYVLFSAQQKINLHVSGRQFEPKADSVRAGIGDLCFLVQNQVNDALERLKADEVPVLKGGQSSRSYRCSWKAEKRMHPRSGRHPCRIYQASDHTGIGTDSCRMSNAADPLVVVPT